MCPWVGDSGWVKNRLDLGSLAAQPKRIHPSPVKVFVRVGRPLTPDSLMLMSQTGALPCEAAGASRCE